MANSIIGAQASIGPFAAEADEAVADAPLEHGDQRAERGGDREHVHDHGLRGTTMLWNTNSQQQERQQQHGADEERQALSPM